MNAHQRTAAAALSEEFCPKKSGCAFGLSGQKDNRRLLWTSLEA
jgi:hypothetical protein